MKLVNKTSVSAALLKTLSARDEDRSLGCVIARSTFRVEGGKLLATPEEPWPIGPEPTDTALGQMPGDKPFYMGGVDVLMGGMVRQPEGRARPRLDVELELGRLFRRRIAVFGERRWVRGPKGRLEKSEPEPFIHMELGYERAFGGEAPTAYGAPMPYMANRLGRGFYLDEGSAENQALPNLEDPNHLIESIDDFPEPVGLGYYPLDGALRVKNAADHALSKVPVTGVKPGAAPPVLEPGTKEPIRPNQLLPTFLNMAHPNMVIEVGKEPRAGDVVRLSHGLHDGDLDFVMPDLGMHVHVQLAERQYVFPLHLDQIGIVAGEGRVFFSLRCVFEYRVVKGERRRVTLYPGGVPEVIPEAYRVVWKDRWDKGWWDRDG